MPDISQQQSEEPYDPFFKNKIYGSNLLNRPQPENYGTEWLESLKTQATEDFPSGRSLLVFRIANEWLALPSHCIKEITQSTYIHKLPHATTSVLLGISNVHGELLVTISMQSFLELPDTSPASIQPQKTCQFARNIIMEVNKNIIVFPVNEIYGLTQIELSSLESPPISIVKSMKNYCIGIFPLNDLFIGLLNETLIINTLNEKYL